ncbi:hypothetical protein CXF72_17015 [Psychromonas sp. MB-3u-54]|uniref:protein DpdI n=1 Tax=Psychromonas sp. MB-3u-54 TaxID=2058319 RepID=UPI000C33EA7A|nr:protein DpdI [Psychromonas sp. MB-3u-54]PKH01373.1 hypothetical protein CXF72_17015 [Psychromonas sp. MB-3u-54]
MSLKNQIADMCKEIKYYQDSASLEDKKQDLKTISMRLDTASKKVEHEAKKHDCLSDIDEVNLYCDSSINALKQAKMGLQAFKILWETLEDKSLSDDQNTLFNLTESLKSTSDLFTDFHKVIWVEWLDEQINLAQVDDFILEHQRSVHGNIDLYNKYNFTKRDLDNQINDFNFDKTQLLRIKQFAHRCAELKEKMNTEDLPEGVKKLFDKLNRVGNIAFVSLLTPEVMDWLKKNNKLDTLVVRQR